MNIQHKKNDASEDPVMNSIANAKKYMDKNSKTVLTVCAIALAAVAAILFYANARSANIRKAQEIFGIGVLNYQSEQYEQALASFLNAAENYRRTPVGRMSAFMAGSIYLQQDNPDAAIEWFTVAVSGGGTGFVKAQAFEGMAAAYELKGDSDSAIKYLERALSNGKAPHRHTAIRWKLALLNHTNDKDASIAHCEAIIGDTLSTAYKQKAENMLAVLKNTWEAGTMPQPKVAEPAADSAEQETSADSAAENP